MKVAVYDINNKKTGDIELAKDVFGIEPRADILTRVVNWQRAKRQAGTHKTKTISEISGTTKKPFKQKGTGNARQGSLRSAQMRGGQTTFGPVVRSHAHDLTKKVRALGLKSALSAKQKEGNLIVLKECKLKDAKTKNLSKIISDFGWKTALIIDGENVCENFSKAARNLYKIDALPSIGANVYDILNHEKLVLTEAAITKLQERLA